MTARQAFFKPIFKGFKDIFICDWTLHLGRDNQLAVNPLSTDGEEN